MGVPLLLFAFRFLKPEEIRKAKEIFKAAPGYVNVRWANKRLFERKERFGTRDLPTGDGEAPFKQRGEDKNSGASQ